MNRDRTRELLPQLGVSKSLNGLIDEFVGDNDLATADDLRYAAAACQEQKWASFREEELLPAAQHGRHELVLQLEHARLKFWKNRDDLDFDLLARTARGKGLDVEEWRRPLFRKGKGKGKGKGKLCLIFSWAEKSQGPEVQHLQSVTRKAQHYRMQSLWSKLFRWELLPFAEQAFTVATLRHDSINRLLCGKQGDIEALQEMARRKGITYTRRGCIRNGYFSWRRILVDVGGILDDVETGLELLKATTRARQRIWEEFCLKVIRPEASRGQMSHHLAWSILLCDFSYVSTRALKADPGETLDAASLVLMRDDFEDLQTLFARAGVTLENGRSRWRAQPFPIGIILERGIPAEFTNFAEGIALISW